jgi:hypothetical protein
VSLLRSTDPLRKNDVLASNLLFAILAILLCEHLYGWIMPSSHLNLKMLPVALPGGAYWQY